MSDEIKTSQNGGPSDLVPPKISIQQQYIRDVSFENIIVRSSERNVQQPEVQVQVGVNGNKFAESDNRYEITISLRVNAMQPDDHEKIIFITQLEYSGIFLVENVPNEQLHPVLMIECPRLLFPFIRRIVSDLTRDGGFMPLNLDPIDFVQLYKNEIKRRQDEKNTETSSNVN